MKPTLRWFSLILFVSFFSIALHGCAASDGGCCSKKPKLSFGTLTNDQICAAIHANPMAPGENIKISTISERPDKGFYLVQIRDKERLHRHNTHSGKVVLWKGKGTLLLDGQPRLLMEGAQVEIPAGVPHAFTNEWDQPSVAVVEFAPTYDGKDIEYLE